MKVVTEVDDRLHGDLGIGSCAPLPDLLDGDRATGLLDAGQAAGAEDCGVLEVDVQHHLALLAGPRTRVAVVGGVQLES
jgi:hypothetical protein